MPLLRMLKPENIEMGEGRMRAMTGRPEIDAANYAVECNGLGETSMTSKPGNCWSPEALPHRSISYSDLDIPGMSGHPLRVSP